MLCLRCGHWWPAGTRFCGSCRRSLNARYCPENHKNPLGADTTCLTCNQGPLTQGARALPTGWLVGMVSFIIMAFLAIAGLTHLGWLVGLLGGLMSRVSQLLLGNMHFAFWRALESLIVWWAAIWIGSHLLPVEYGGAIRRGLARLFDLILKLFGGFLTFCWRTLVAKTRTTPRAKKAEDEN